MQMLDTLRRLSQSVVSARRQQRRHELVYDTAHASNSHGFPCPPTQRLKGTPGRSTTLAASSACSVSPASCRYSSLSGS
jgi:hypothetical protein